MRKWKNNSSKVIWYELEWTYSRYYRNKESWACLYVSAEIKVKETILKTFQRRWLLSFPLALLKYNWQIKLCIFKMCTMMIWYTYTLWNGYHEQVN